jgi:hypothetical protein
MVIWVSVKTTLDIPDRVFRRAKVTAAERGQALREFVTEAIEEKLSGRRTSSRDQPVEPPWRRGFGRLRPLRRETARILRVIDRDLGMVEPEDRE